MLEIISLLPIQTMIGSIGVRMMIDWLYGRRVCSAPGEEVGGLITLHAHSLSSLVIRFSFFLLSLFLSLFPLSLSPSDSLPHSACSPLDSEVDGNDRLVSQCPPGMTGARSRPREAARPEAGALLCFFSLHSSERGQQQDRHARQGWHAALFFIF